MFKKIALAALALSLLAPVASFAKTDVDNIGTGNDQLRGHNLIG